MFVLSVLEMEENTFAAPNKIVFKLLGENLSEEQMALNHQTPQYKILSEYVQVQIPSGLTSILFITSTVFTHFSSSIRKC